MGKEKINNLLIVGYTGSGKSTLANVLSGTDDFEEYSSQIFKKKEFIWKGTKYNVVDTNGIGKEITCEKIEEIIHLIPEGISQILFVIDGKFTTEGILGTFILESDIADYITIVRTKFSNFKNESACKKDREDLCKKSEKICKLCENIVYVDNPPTKITVYDEDDEETIEINKKRREKSKKILLEHLEKVCHKLKMWDNLRPVILQFLRTTNYI
ncbi:unnamed protein product [Rhizophagus irregularis]|uniref:AIG1-type G domain-containing protein n=1 Tax=Rhizophagus irregularis TaxID=588596 RepID=A0A2N1NST9_9GLOM|nr:hypothetical protein RhiirC2_862250 [Rhizophagus irregularis]CAB4381723.1 unnamed protein product [Rhizophagus irregularis]CAB5314542.1 unnamed protein product [Rhizophagus irregularis]